MGMKDSGVLLMNGWVPSPEAFGAMASLIIPGANALLLHVIQEMDKIICKEIRCNLSSRDLCFTEVAPFVLNLSLSVAPGLPWKTLHWDRQQHSGVGHPCSARQDTAAFRPAASLRAPAYGCSLNTWAGQPQRSTTGYAGELPYC